MESHVHVEDGLAIGGGWEKSGALAAHPKTARHGSACCRARNKHQDHFEVNDTAAVLGTWNADIGIFRQKGYLKALSVFCRHSHPQSSDPKPHASYSSWTVRDDMLRQRCRGMVTLAAMLRISASLSQVLDRILTSPMKYRKPGGGSSNNPRRSSPIKTPTPNPSHIMVWHRKVY